MSRAKQLLFASGLLLFGFGMASTYIFSVMWFKEKVYVFENILAIRAFETGWAAGLMLFGLYAVIWVVRHAKE